MRKLVLLLLLAAGIAAGAWWYLGRDRIDPDAPLAFVPAETPYVFASTAPPPEAVVAQWQAQMEAMGEAYRGQLDDTHALISASPDADPRLLAVLDVLRQELAGKPMAEAVEGIGLSPRGRMAVYGLGLLPVARIELVDAAKMHAFLGRLATAAGDIASAADIDGASTWTYAPPEAPVAGLAAIAGNHLVVSLMPRAADAAVHRQILGLDRPAQSLAASGGLRALNREYGYVDFISGYIDTRRLLAAAIDGQDTIRDAFATALGIPQPNLDATCRDELAALAANWPRMSLGYTRLDRDRAEARGVIETRDDIAQALMKLRAPMPGLAAVDGDTLVHLGLSFRLAALPEVVNGFAKQVDAAPWKCASLQPLNDGFAQARQGLTNPALFMVAPVFRGFHVALTKLDPGDGSLPRDLAGTLAIGSDNPAALIGLAQSVAPQIAEAGLKPDGEVRALPPLPALPLQLPLHAAMDERTLAISLGEGEQTRLPAALKASDAAQPLLAIGATSRFYQLLADAMLRNLPAPPADADDATRAQHDLVTARLRRDATVMRDIYATLFKRVEMRVELTDHGIELHQGIDMP